MHRRVKTGKEAPRRLAERWARYNQDRPHGQLVWLHAASVGESLIQITLARGLASLRPDVSFIFTCQTLTAARRIQAELDQAQETNLRAAVQIMAPVDTPAIARRFVAHWRPDLSVFAESEVWPNLLFELDRR
ncbi:MAG: 3-deoxy-D-manno-octulosonic acid transferase, partial [Henriciella sp.]